MQRLRLSRLCCVSCVRHASFFDDLQQAITAKWDADKPRVEELKKKFGESVVGQVNVGQIYGGMRDILGLVYEPSLLDAQEGIRFRGLSIPECQEKLPKAPNGSQPLPEAMLYLLLTGSVPTEAQASALNQELIARADHESVKLAQKVIEGLPNNVHPMTQYSMGVLALQSSSLFAQAYASGKANKKNYWQLALDDSLNCIARSTQVAAMVYQKIKTGRTDLPCALNPKVDWAANFASQLGYSDPAFFDCMRLYLSIHVDHEGGNVSAHTTSLVGSALSDPYLAFSAGLNGLAGPLHGLANQEVLKYLFDTLARIKQTNVNMNDRAAVKEALNKVTWELLDSGRVVPGYGHAVLRKTDPRYMCQREFALVHLKDNELFKLVDVIYEVMPDILTKHGKTKNPYPNVDAHSGVLLQHFGLVEQDYYTVLFGVSRQLGVLSSLVWDRLQGRPIERPKSITSEALFEKFKV